MKDTACRDYVLTIGGLSLMAGVFVFAIYLPGHHASIRINQEIAAAEQEIRDIPIRVAELAALQQQLAKREAYLKRAAALFPARGAAHQVVQEIAHLARRAHLEIQRFEPLAPEHQQSYERMTFRLSFRGTFQGFSQFCEGLESQVLLFSIDQIRVSAENEKNKQITKGEMLLSVYMKNDDSAKIAENFVQREAKSADRESR
jgi:Tfp pilus assembly protein PilO